MGGLLLSPSLHGCLNKVKANVELDAVWIGDVFISVYEASLA